jgi:hypothetical protein
MGIILKKHMLTACLLQINGTSIELVRPYISKHNKKRIISTNQRINLCKGGRES